MIVLPLLLVAILLTYLLGGMLLDEGEPTPTSPAPIPEGDTGGNSFAEAASYYRHSGGRR